MVLTLIEAKATAEAAGDFVTSSIIEQYAKTSDILRVIPWQTISGNAVSYNRLEKLPGVGFRAVNEAYDEDTGIVNPQTESLTIAGGELDVDTFLTDSFGEGIRSSQEMMKVKALALTWTRTFIKGDSSSDPRVFDGLQRRVTGSQLIANGNTSGGDALSLAKLNEAIDEVEEPTHLAMSDAMARRLNTAYQDSSVGGHILFGVDDFGREMMSYNGLPILKFKRDGDRNHILDFDEANPGGGTPASTSIYVLSLMPRKCFGIQGRIRGVEGINVTDLGLLQSMPRYRTRVEWYTGLMIEHGMAVSRLWGIKDAPVVV